MYLDLCGSAEVREQGNLPPGTSPEVKFKQLEVLTAYVNGQS